MIRRGRASTWLLLAAVVVFTMIGAWFARNEDNEHDDVLEPPRVDAQVESAASSLAPLEPDGRAAATRTPPAAAVVTSTSTAPSSAVPQHCITGRLVDARGHALVGWEVGVIDSDDSPSTQKDTALGELKRRDPAVSDSSGSFRIEHMSEGAYILHARSGKTVAEFDSWWVRTGTTEVRLVVPLDVVISQLEGRVVDREGKKVAGARVTLSELGDPTSSVVKAPRKLTTNDDGSFVIDELSAFGTGISVSGTTVATTLFQPSVRDFSRPLVLQVQRACRVRLQGALTNEPRWLSATDAAGGALIVEEIPRAPAADSKLDASDTWFRVGVTRVEVSSDLMAEYKVSEETSTLELRDDAGNVVKRQSVRLMPDQLNVVTW